MRLRSMRLRSIYAKALRDQRWQIGGYAFAMATMAAMVVFIYPSYKDDLALVELPPALQALLGNDLSIATAAGFLNAEYFSWVPVLLVIYAITQGTGAVAGEESAGTIDLLLAQPVHRIEVALARTAAAITGASLIIILGWLGYAVSVPFIEIEVTLWDTFVAMANMLPLTLAFFGLAFWLGVAAANRAQAIAIATGIATVAYFIDTLAAGVESIDAIRYASPFYYFGRGLPLVEGIDWAHVAVLLASAAVFVALGIRAFDRRDVAAGGATGLSWADLMRRSVG